MIDRLALAAQLVTVALTGVASAADPPKTMEEAFAQMTPYTGVHRSGVDTRTLTGKVMCGYQGWFCTPGDGSGRGWVHYGFSTRSDRPSQVTFDFWPDLTEFPSAEKFATPLKHADGRTAYVFSPQLRPTVLRHFQWMQEHGIDGVFLQRFGAELRAPGVLNGRNVVTANVQAGANRYGRTWAMMYDLSGMRTGEMKSVVMEDWKRLVDRMAIRKDPAYLHHHGRPVVAVWGIGFDDGRNYTVAECGELVEFLKNDPVHGGNTVMVGVPTWWRTLTRDTVNDPALLEVIAKADIVSPWTVGRYGVVAGALEHAQKLVQPDLEWCQQKRKDYLPVIFPGFSWHNLKTRSGQTAKSNAIPRRGGRFLWAQAMADRQAGAEAAYVAMFDEIDEGTAIFKCTNDPPVGAGPFVTYEGLPSDHYLWLAGEIGKVYRGERAVSVDMPQRAPTLKTQPAGAALP